MPRRSQSSRRSGLTYINARRAVRLIAAASFGYAIVALIAVRPIHFLAATGVLVICFPVHLALSNEIRARRHTTLYGPVAKWGVNEDAAHANRPAVPPSSSARQWWERLTSPMVIAASPLLIIPVGLLSTPRADADPFTDYSYLSALNVLEVPYVDDTAAISLGRGICDALDQGVSATAIQNVGMTAGYTRVQVDRLVDAAIGAYCHEHWTAA